MTLINILAPVENNILAFLYIIFGIVLFVFLNIKYSKISKNKNIDNYAIFYGAFIILSISMFIAGNGTLGVFEIVGGKDIQMEKIEYNNIKKDFNQDKILDFKRYPKYFFKNNGPQKNKRFSAGYRAVKNTIEVYDKNNFDVMSMNHELVHYNFAQLDYIKKYKIIVLLNEIENSIGKLYDRKNIINSIKKDTDFDYISKNENFCRNKFDGQNDIDYCRSLLLMDIFIHKNYSKELLISQTSYFIPYLTSGLEEYPAYYTNKEFDLLENNPNNKKLKKMTILLKKFLIL